MEILKLQIVDCLKNLKWSRFNMDIHSVSLSIKGKSDFYWMEVEHLNKNGDVIYTQSSKTTKIHFRFVNAFLKTINHENKKAVV